MSQSSGGTSPQRAAVCHTILRKATGGIVRATSPNKLGTACPANRRRLVKLLTRLGNVAREPFEDDQCPIVIGPLRSTEDFGAKSGHISPPTRQHELHELAIRLVFVRPCVAYAVREHKQASPRL